MVEAAADDVPDVLIGWSIDSDGLTVTPEPRSYELCPMKWSLTCSVASSCLGPS